jgi:hypothetical protein
LADCRRLLAIFNTFSSFSGIPKIAGMIMVGVSKMMGASNVVGTIGTNVVGTIGTDMASADLLGRLDLRDLPALPDLLGRLDLRDLPALADLLGRLDPLTKTNLERGFPI